MEPHYFNESPVASVILLLTVLTSYMAFQNGDLKYKFMLNPYRLVRNRDWPQLFTSGLIHADWGHLLFNMVSFYFFAFPLERIIGHGEFFLLYALSLPISALPDVIRHRDHASFHALGASGAVSAVVFSMILFYPDMRLAFIFFPVPISGWLFGLIYMGYSFYASRYVQDNIGHSAHLWGAIAGLLLTVLLEPSAATNFLDWLRAALS